ncbi:alkaline phosphatase family protein [Haloarchaeobius sp. HRN-SO-5]|uniref:alkaline phosphatase family protein n=1 Tax=Haloarchaeobius sp. HRN-SO-5 TaxID=3446118 RepID=UPI003EBF188C
MGTETDAGVDTLLVGIDAACRPILDRLFDANVTPNLASFFADGATGPLESQLPPWTPSAWPSLYTGVNPGKHGVFDFLRFDGYDWDIVNYDDVRERALWELLGEHGLTSVVVNVPVTHPAQSFPGALVPGYVAPEGPACHPDGLLDELRDELGGYRVYPREGEDREDQLAGYRDCVQSRADAFTYLADRFDPDFGFVQFQVCDTVFHERPDDWGAVESVYTAVDDAFAQLLDECDPETVVVASDHGIGEYDGYEFRVNEFLADRGYVKSTTDGTGMPSWSSLARERFREGDADEDDGDASESPTMDAAERAVATASKVGLTADRVYAVLDRLGVGEFVADRIPNDVVRAGTRRVDFANSTAFMRSRIELGVRLNLAGREPNGIVSENEYDAVREEVRATLERARTPDGDPVFESVVPREVVYYGPYVDEAPDLLTVPNSFDQFLSASLRGEQFSDPTEPWNHKSTGIVALDGPDVGSGRHIEAATLLDVAPTLCSTLDVPASDRMDGEALSVVPEPAVESYPEYDPDRRSRTVSGDVEQRLADIGYLEGDE